MPATLLRRIGAMIYYTLLLIAVLMLVTGVMHLATGGEAIVGRTHPLLVWIYRAVLLAAIVGFLRVSFLIVTSWALSLARRRLRSVPSSASLVFCR